ncbi:MAG: hypothetical protein KAI16_01175 [Candidatus Pacebacteria bacterium]|nr:hypothetical protein [Candidatus Paceibacterota bacterium]
MKILFKNIDFCVEKIKKIKNDYQKMFGDLGVYGNFFQDKKNGKFSKVIFLDSNIIGYYSIWNNKNHPEVQYFTIILEEKYQTKLNYNFIFEEMFKYLNNKKIQTAFLDSEVKKKNFLKKKGFNVVNICKTGKIKTKEIKVIENKINKNNYKVISLDKVKISKIDFFKLLKNGYYNTHLYNPPFILENKFNIDFFNDNLYKKGSFLIYKNNKIVGFFISRHEDNNEIWLGDFYLENTDNIEVLNLCLKEFIDIVKIDNNISIISYEIDSVNKYASFIFDKMNLSKKINNLNLCQNDL